MKLSNELKNIKTYPFHMPGHKRNASYNIPAGDIDITEIAGFDNLHNPEEVLKNMEYEISDLFKSKRSIISVNGSTCGILSAISAVSNKGDKIIIARNCHKSVYNACFINELDVYYIEPEFNNEFAIYTSISQQSIDRAVNKNPDACAVVITSPTYEGFVSRINCSIPLIIDSAHGAHFGFADFLPQRAEADIVVQSLHKTLPSLTQTAVVHINNENFTEKVKMYMDIYETSSPSYVLLSSVDRCVDFLKNCNHDFADFKKRLNNFYSEIEKLSYIRILKNDDISRIVLACDGLSGVEFAQILRDKYLIEVEGATLNYIILISTVCDTENGFNMLLNALKNIEHSESRCIYNTKTTIPKKHFKSSDIKETVLLKLPESAEKICAEYVYAYPPGIPIIVPGEEISGEMINLIYEMHKCGVNLISDSNSLPESILTKREQ